MVCKYMRSKYNYTPSDYDLYFDFMNIPSNIKLNDSVNLSRRIANVTPLGKTVHLNFNTTRKEFTQNISIFTSLKVDGVEVKFI